MCPQVDLSVDVGSELIRETRAIRKHILVSDRPAADFVHDIRKYCKRTRSYIRLLAEEERHLLRVVDREIAALAKSLAPLRDAEVLSQTASRLKSCIPQVEKKPSKANKRLPEELLKMVVATLDGCLDSLNRLPQRPFLGCREQVFQSLKQMVAGYERSLQTASSGHLHNWRKRVQRLRYQLLLIDETADYAELISMLGKLADILGEHHDVAILNAHMRSGDPSIRKANRVSKRLVHEALALMLSVLSQPDFVSIGLAVSNQSATLGQNE